MKLPWQNKNQVTTLSPKEGYNRWAATYSKESNPIKDLSDKGILKFLPDVQSKIVLDAGCGTGHFCKVLSDRGASKIIGIDFSSAMIETAKQNCPAAEFYSEDISIQFLEKETFDLIICALVLGHIIDIRPALENLAVALKKGGTLLISDFHPFLTLQHAKRTFKDASGSLFEIKHHLHLFQDIIQCLHQHQIVVETLEEPLWHDAPVIYIMKAKKIE